VKLINQTVAMNGTASPGDEPGFPVTISEPGSYRLSGNLVVRTATTTAIEIIADDVTLDLNGFAIIGRPVCLAPVGGSCVPNGIGVHGVRVDNVTVLNGTIRGLGSRGISLVGIGHRVERVRAMNNGDTGIRVGRGAVVIGNITIENGLNGITTDEGSLIASNTVQANGSHGINAGAGSIVSGNVVTSSGFTAISLGAGGLMAGNVMRNNGAGASLVNSFSAAYMQNVLTANGTSAADDVQGGVNAGHNVCNGSFCPAD
jgi:hypothetical protein